MNKRPLPVYFKGSRPSFLDGKKVRWMTLERVSSGCRVDFIRSYHGGKVMLISPCGNIAMVKNIVTGAIDEVEVSELTIV
jgi:hypothetical protein